jgi:hypothetical protein
MRFLMLQKRLGYRAATKWRRPMETVQIWRRDIQGERRLKDTLQMYVNYTSGLRTAAQCRQGFSTQAQLVMPNTGRGEAEKGRRAAGVSLLRVAR